jgi:hypothetical protein
MVVAVYWLVAAGLRGRNSDSMAGRACVGGLHTRLTGTQLLPGTMRWAAPGLVPTTQPGTRGRQTLPVAPVSPVPQEPRTAAAGTSPTWR